MRDERLPASTMPGSWMCLDQCSRLTIRGTISPHDAVGYVVARREFGHVTPFRARIGADGRFVLPTARLGKLANNSFVLGFHAPPNAFRKIHFSAICIDCLAGGTPPGAG